MVDVADPRSSSRVAEKSRYRPKRSQEERRRNTQARVLEAAISVLLEKGYANFTTAEVANRAGVSRGAQMNYFRTRQDLVLATGRYTLERSREEAAAHAKRALASPDVLDAFLENSARFFLGKHYTAMMEVTIAARTDPMIADEIVSLLTEYRQALNAIWRSALCDAGYELAKVDRVIDLTNHIYRGMALTAIWASNERDDEMLREVWLQVARDILTAVEG